MDLDIPTRGRSFTDAAKRDAPSSGPAARSCGPRALAGGAVCDSMQRVEGKGQLLSLPLPGCCCLALPWRGAQRAERERLLELLLTLLLPLLPFAEGSGAHAAGATGRPRRPALRAVPLGAGQVEEPRAAQAQGGCAPCAIGMPLGAGQVERAPSSSGTRCARARAPMPAHAQPGCVRVSLSGHTPWRLRPARIPRQRAEEACSEGERQATQTRPERTPPGVKDVGSGGARAARLHRKRSPAMP